MSVTIRIYSEGTMKLRGVITALLLLVPTVTFAANKEMEVLQRDVALMQEDLRPLHALP